MAEEGGLETNDRNAVCDSKGTRRPKRNSENRLSLYFVSTCLSKCFSFGYLQQLMLRYLLLVYLLNKVCAPGFKFM